MPLTNDLGDAVAGRAGFKGGNFEEWLTLQATPLPFLDGFANTARRAQAEKVTAAIAAELDRCADAATADEAPLWLLQLVALWHAEKAVVLTFNYDLLVERAVTSLLPCSGFAGGDEVDIPKVILGPQVVYPAPPASGTSSPSGASLLTEESFQLIKLHGSLDWYWAQGDGATLSRSVDESSFGALTEPPRADLTGIRTLDRFLIPPVLSKDSYYDISLAHVLWRTAHDKLLEASSVTLIGYSIPPGDRITSEMLRLIPEGTPVDIVDIDPGDVDNVDTLAGRAQRQIGLEVRSIHAGVDAVRTYVTERLENAANAAIARAAVFADEDLDVVAMMPRWRRPGSIGAYYGIWDGHGDAPDLMEAEFSSLAHNQSYRSVGEIAVDEHYLSGRPEGEIVTAHRLAQFTRPLRMLRDDGDPFVAVNATPAYVGRRRVLAVALAPSQ